MLWASPPFLQTLGPWFPNEIQTCSHLKRGLWTTGQQSSSSSLSQVRRLWRQLYPNSSTRLVWCSWCLDPSLSPFLVKFTQIHRFCLTILIRLRFSRLVVHLFLPLNFLLTCLDTALCEQLLWQWMFVSYPPCEGCQWLSSGQLSDQQSSPWLCSLVNQTERPFWSSGNLCRCFELISWLACHHILVCWEWIGGFLLNVSQNHNNYSLLQSVCI